MALSPMMKQYKEIKEKHKDAILFFRLGDFYEMFYEDAKICSRELELVLTGKQCGEAERAPMCGVPHHASQNYIAKLVDRGYKVAVCEQMEDPQTAKGIVKREVIQIITPGTVISQTMLLEKENSYIVSVYHHEKEVGLAYSDITTGEIRVTSSTGFSLTHSIINEIERISPKEILYGKDRSMNEEESLEPYLPEAYTVTTEETGGSLNRVQELLRDRYPSGLLSYGIEYGSPEAKALGLLLRYLKNNYNSDFTHLLNVKKYGIGNRMALDKSTLINLEITGSPNSSNSKNTLLTILDMTNTAMGARMMKRWLKEPLTDKKEIIPRQDSVEILFNNPILKNNFEEQLKGIYDLERIGGRIALETINPRDLLALAKSVMHIPDIKWELLSLEGGLLKDLGERIYAFQEIYELIERSICEDCPLSVKEGGIFKEGYSEELDVLKASIKEGQKFIASLETEERARTGIRNLKVGFNKVFGYYIEVTKSNYNLVPEDYIRKQTLVGSERFVTPKLKEVEALVLSAENKINQLEYRLFTEIREYLKGFISDLQITAEALSILDVLCSFAKAALVNGYVKPEIREDYKIIIKGGRHPVVEKNVKNEIYVPNDTYMDKEDNILLLITGPNMSGKSTYMRQVALIILMAQTGSYVPCESASLGLVDRIFTRIGAQDNLALGQSTFLVEMSEVANILNNATEKSLILLDEVGRGTSTYDGLSIAWALSEYLLKDSLKARTLFATHYHEMTALEGKLKGFKNLNVEVKEEGEEILFLHTIKEGSASRSYGIHVASLAGVPKELLEKAEKKLKELESASGDVND